MIYYYYYCDNEYYNDNCNLNDNVMIVMCNEIEWEILCEGMTIIENVIWYVMNNENMLMIISINMMN